jgi:transposase-like protein
MAERGVPIDHFNIYRWVRKFTPKLEAALTKIYPLQDSFIHWLPKTSLE